jgi:hypothetical protein
MGRCGLDAAAVRHHLRVLVYSAISFYAVKSAENFLPK